MAEFLVSVALKRYTSDNVACIVLDFAGKDDRTAISSSSAGSFSNSGGNWLKGLFGQK